MGAISVELIVMPMNHSICYVNMSVVPRIGDSVTLFTADGEEPSGKVTDVLWLIDLSEDCGDNQDQSANVVVTVQLETNRDIIEFNNWVKGNDRQTNPD